MSDVGKEARDQSSAIAKVENQTGKKTPVVREFDFKVNMFESCAEFPGADTLLCSNRDLPLRNHIRPRADIPVPLASDL
jgi:hypothetical protein